MSRRLRYDLLGPPEQLRRRLLAAAERGDDVSAVRRVSLVGAPGSGKTTFGRQLERACRLPMVELDALFHQPNWTPLDEEVFRAKVSEVVAGDRWIIDGNYSAVRDLVWARADTVIVFEIGRLAVMRRVIARTLRRIIRREELWNGNRESFTNLYSLDPTQNLIRWTWTKYPYYVERYRAAETDPQFAHIHFVTFGSPGEASAWLLTLGEG